MTIELLPCPFCGGSASIEYKVHGVVELGCDNVGCGVLPSATQLSVEAAVTNWNRRAPSPETRERGSK